MRVSSPAQDHIERRLSLDAELIRYPESTYFLRASGDSMKDAGIFERRKYLGCRKSSYCASWRNCRC
ncbi:LexA family protein [Providencia hangzhouensis]|uniref:LexA family protein n=1 Tax=Providencia hangzhouensis TaxID=3031799 RepID=UPI0034DDA5D8